jgi:hypothetical protein
VRMLSPDVVRAPHGRPAQNAGVDRARVEDVLVELTAGHQDASKKLRSTYPDAALSAKSRAATSA